MSKRFLVSTIVFLAILATIVYLLTRSTLIYYADYSVLDRVTAIFLLAAEAFIILHGIGYSLNIFKSYRYRKLNSMTKDGPLVKMKQEPAVAVLVAARHEPKEILEFD